MILHKSISAFPSFSTVLALLVFVVGFVPSAIAQEATEPAADRFDAKVTAFQAANKNTINRALVSYLGKLDSMRQTMTKRGDLDAVLAVKAEEERVGKEQRVNVADVVAKPPELNALMTAFVQGMATHNKTQQARFKTLIEQERGRLQQQMTELTKANKIDEAIAKKVELAAFDAKLRKIFVAAVKKSNARPVAAGPGLAAPEGVRVDEEGRVDLTMGRDGGAGAAVGKKAEGRFKPGKLFGNPRNPDKPRTPLDKRSFFDR